MDSEEYSSSFDLPPDSKPLEEPHEESGFFVDVPDDQVETEQHYPRRHYDSFPRRGRGGSGGPRGRFRRQQHHDHEPEWAAVPTTEYKTNLSAFSEPAMRERRRGVHFTWFREFLAEERVPPVDNLEFPTTVIRYSIEELLELGGFAKPADDAAPTTDVADTAAEVDNVTREGELVTNAENDNKDELPPLPQVPEDVLIFPSNDTIVGDPSVHDIPREVCNNNSIQPLPEYPAVEDVVVKMIDEKTESEIPAEPVKEPEIALPEPEIPVETQPSKQESTPVSQESVPFFSDTEYLTLPAAKTKKQTKSSGMTAVFDIAESNTSAAAAAAQSPEKKKKSKKKKDEAESIPLPRNWGPSSEQKKVVKFDEIVAEETEKKKKQEKSKPKEKLESAVVVSAESKKVVTPVEQTEKKKTQEESKPGWTTKPKEKKETPVSKWGSSEPKKAVRFDDIVAEQTEKKKMQEEQKASAAPKDKKKDASSSSSPSATDLFWGPSEPKKSVSFDEIVSEQTKDKKKQDKEQQKAQAAASVETKNQNAWGVTPVPKQTVSPIEAAEKQKKEEEKTPVEAPAPVKTTSAWGTVQKKKTVSFDDILAEQKEKKKKEDYERSTALVIEEALRREKEERQRNAWGINRAERLSSFSEIMDEQKTMVLIQEEEVMARQAQQQSQWQPLPTSPSASSPAASKKAKGKASKKVIEEDEGLFWGEAPASTESTETSEESFWETEESKKKGKKGKESTPNAWTKPPKLTPDPVSPSSKKKAQQKTVVSAWGAVPKSSPKSMDEIMREEKAAVEANRREKQKQREQQQQEKKTNAWGMPVGSSGSGSSLSSAENFPPLGGTSTSGGSAARGSGNSKRTQSGTGGGLNYSRVVGPVAPTILQRDEAFPALGAPASKGKR